MGEEVGEDERKDPNDQDNPRIQISPAAKQYKAKGLPFSLKATTHKAARRQLTLKERNIQDEGFDKSFDNNSERILRRFRSDVRTKSCTRVDNKTWEMFGSTLREQQDQSNR